MKSHGEPQHDIARTLNRLLPIRGAPKDLAQIRDQLRLLNEIRDPSDDRLSRIVVGYFSHPRFSDRGTRFVKVDRHLTDHDPTGRWTRVRMGPTVWEPVPAAGGRPPRPETISARLPAILASCSHSGSLSFYLWDLLKEHFGVTRENNRYYRQWLEALSAALKTHPGFVMVGMDEETDIPVEWMLATDRQDQIRDAVASRMPELLGWMQRTESLLYLTRDLVHRFFSPEAVDDTYDIHAYYSTLSAMLLRTPAAIQIRVEEGARRIEAWCLTDRVRGLINERLDAMLDWLLAVGKPRGIEAISQQLLPSYPQLSSAEMVLDQLSHMLSRDLRFVLADPSGAWRAVPSGPEENLPFYHILWQAHRPLSEAALRKKIHEYLETGATGFNLADDDRFRRYRSDTWGLSEWIDIEDWAYEHLRANDMALQSATIRSQACHELGIPSELVMFIPQNDPRFLREPHGMWRSRHYLNDSELDQLLALLDDREAGLKLDELVAQAIGRDVGETDAADRLLHDERFVLLDGHWFARDRVKYSLSDQDLDQFLKTLCARGTGLRLTTLVEQVLNRDAQLTDAEERLRADLRFREIIPGVWVAAQVQPPSHDRSSLFNRPVRSADVPVVPEDQHTLVEEFTGRSRLTRRARTACQPDRITRTLSLLDVRHGNLVLDSTMAGLLPAGCEQAVHFTDELGTEFTVWIDCENSLLQGFDRWFEARHLTFGDKVRITSGDDAGFLEIEVTGQRDERVYQEALQRQDVETVVEEARQVGKSYHDLMIEVMRSLNQATGKQVRLHREDIYDLVNHRRTASRSYIFSLLSLTDCPYEELRYFVPHGAGYWSFDPARRKAFEMKMKQLVEKIQQLQADREHLEHDLVSARAAEARQAAAAERLQVQAREQKTRILELSADNDRLSKANARLDGDNKRLLQRVDEMDARLSSLEEQATKHARELEDVHSERDVLANELANLEQERHQLRDSHSSQAQEMEVLTREKSTLEQEYAALQDRVEQLASQDATMRQRTGDLRARIDVLTAENRTMRQHLRQARVTLDEMTRQSTTTRERLEGQLARARKQEEQLYDRLETLERRRMVTAGETARLSARLDLARAGLRSPLGKGFVTLLRALGGPDMSDL